MPVQGHYRKKQGRMVEQTATRAERAKKVLAPFLIICMFFAGALGLRAVLLNRSSHVLGGPYALIDTHGNNITQRDFHGRYTLIYFGYTHCVDVCPLTLSTISMALDMMGASARRIVPVFITIDPSRDTPEVVADYISHFSPNIVGLTGTTGQIRSVVETFHVMAKRRDAPAGYVSSDYLMDHSSVLYLMDGDNRLVSVLPVDTSPQEIARRLRRLVPSS